MSVLSLLSMGLYVLFCAILSDAAKEWQLSVQQKSKT